MGTSASKTSTNSRLIDDRKEPCKTLRTLTGYANKPLTSLEEAVGPLSNLVDNVKSQATAVKSNVGLAKNGLSLDETAAIYLYTLQLNGNHRNLSTVLNETLCLQNQNSIEPWMSYLKLFLTALFKLPSVNNHVWCGIREDLCSKYSKGDCFIWLSFSSCAASRKILELDKYLGKSGIRTIFSIECMNGKAIHPYSHLPIQDEILLLPCTYFQVTDIVNQPDGLNIISLRELTPPYVLLEPPFNLSNQLPIPKAKVENTAMIAAAAMKFSQSEDFITTDQHSQTEHDSEKCKSKSETKASDDKNRCTHLHSRLVFCAESGVYMNPRSSTATAIWYFYSPKHDSWFWTPYKNFTIWMSVSELSVTKGYWTGQQPVALNIEIINYLENFNPIPPPSIVRIAAEIETTLLKL